MADNPMLKFVGLGQAYPDKRAADDRADDFLEISRSFIVDKAEEQASPARNAAFPIAPPIARCTIISLTGCA